MAIFPRCFTEEKVQVDDKTRLDATTTFVSQDEAAVTLIRVKPETAGSFIDVTAKKYLDWSYTIDGSKTITVEVTTNGAPETKDFTLEVISVADDCLFSGDQNIIPYEGEILKYVRKGRASWLDKHRESQERIIESLDEKKIWKPCSTDDTDQYEGVPVPYTKADICALTGDDFEQFKNWSKFMTLEMIFTDLSKQVDDVFNRKAEEYRAMKEYSCNRSCLRLDKDGDGKIECEDFIDQDSGTLFRV